MPQAVVTGANGYIGIELVRQLCAKGYHVVGTVRPTLSPTKADELKAVVSGLPGSLRLVPAELLVPGAFDEAVSGSDYVFHVASPFVLKVEDPQRDLIDPALEGTRNVFSSVAKHKGVVKKVVLTSSVAAITNFTDAQPPVNGVVYTEEDWNTSSTLETQAYMLSKALAEREAHKLAAELGVPLATICPSFVLGPISTPSSWGTSIEIMKNFLLSRPSGPPAPSITWNICDVRDVAAAHIAAAEIEAATGRFIVSHRKTTSSRFFTDVIKARLPQLGIADGEETEHKDKLDPSRALTVLKLELTPPEVTVGDMAESLVRFGLVA